MGCPLPEPALILALALPLWTEEEVPHPEWGRTARLLSLLAQPGVIYHAICTRLLISCSFSSLELRIWRSVGGRGGTQLVTLREPWSSKCPSLDQACSWDRRPKDCQSFQEQGGTEKVQALLYLLNKCLSSPRYVPNPVLDIGDTQESEPSPCPFESAVH